MIRMPGPWARAGRSEEHTSELQSLAYLVCRLLLEKKKALRLPGSAARTSKLCACLTIKIVPMHQRTLKSTFPNWTALPFSATTSAISFFNDTATTEIYTLSLHDALPI